jgi:hypothetical protein
MDGRRASYDPDNLASCDRGGSSDKPALVVQAFSRKNNVNGVIVRVGGTSSPAQGHNGFDKVKFV